MSTLKFSPPKSVVMIRKRCDKPLVDNRGVLGAYLHSVNSDTELDNVESDVKHVAKALQFNIHQTNPYVSVGPFLIKW